MQANPDYLSFARQLADMAGEILRRYFRADIAVESKPDNSPVTLADREVEQKLRVMIEQQFPTHGIFGEEFYRKNEMAEYQWVIDPIDGTRAFIAGQPTFTTLIALTQNGIPILGVIDQPITRERWDNNSPSPLRGRVRVRHSPKGDGGREGGLAEATLATTAMKYFSEKEATAFTAISKQCAHTTFGGDAYLFGQLANGKIDIVVEAGLKPYDFCALVPVIENAGGIITDWEGKPLTIHSQGRVIAAATKELHEAALKILQATI